MDTTILRQGILLLGIVAVLIIYWGRNIKVQELKVNLPKEGILSRIFAFVFGEIYNLAANFDHCHDYISNGLAVLNGENYVLTLPFSARIIVTGKPANLKHVLQSNFDNYSKSFTQPMFFPVLGKGIFNVDGQDWQRQRKLASNIFTTQHFKYYVGSVFQKHTQQLILFLKDAAKRQTEVDIYQILLQLTFDTFTEIAFSDNDVENFKESEKKAFSEAFDYCQGFIARRIFFYPSILIVEKLTCWNAEFKKAVSILRTFAGKIIQKRRQQHKEGKHDLLYYLLHSLHEEDAKPTDDDLIDQLLNFILAGRDTTAQVLSWCLYELSSHGEVVQKIREELIKVQPSSEENSFQYIKKLKYTQAVLLETLRLHPSVPLNGKQAKKDDVLPDGSAVSRGDIVGWSSYSMGRDTHLWGKDACAFNPQRWLEMSHQPCPYTFPAFHAGPRMCLGQSFAQLEGVCVLSQLVELFDFVLVPGAAVDYGISLTLPMKTGMKMRLGTALPCMGA